MRKDNLMPPGIEKLIYIHIIINYYNININLQDVINLFQKGRFP
jgi:hypothetical protein